MERTQNGTQPTASEVRRGRERRRHRRHLGVAVGAATAVGLAVGGAAAAGAAAAASQPAAGRLTAASTATHPSTGHPLFGRFVRHAVSGRVTVRTKNGTFETYEFDRGILRSVTASSIVLAPADAPTTTLSAAITSTTHFRGLTQSQLQPGDQVVVVEQGGNALIVGARAPKTPTPPAG